jgi:hypothetical protein
MILLKATREASSMQTMEELPSDAAAVALALAVAGDAMAYLLESAELFLMSIWIISPGRSRW